MMIWSLSTAVAGWSLYHISPQSLTVVSGLLSGVSGILWLVLFATRTVRLPRRLSQPSPQELGTIADHAS
jgi:hypothetical protein